MSSLTWLHLSDWHQKGIDFDRQVARDRLIDDIRNRAQIDPRLAHIDFIVFSGDVAFSGQGSEYKAAKEYLFDKVLEATDLKSTYDRLFIVPGNHDLNREAVYEMLPPTLQKPFESNEQINDWLMHDKKRKRLLEPFEAFRQFVSNYTGQQSPEYANSREWVIDGKTVALLGLNSAWMCGRNKNMQGEVYDYGYALIGEPQIHTALDKIANANVRIIILHHPFDFLSEFDRNQVEKRLQRSAHFILRGHQHIPQIKVAQGTEGDCVIIPAGACYDRRLAKDPRYTNAYNMVHLDLDTGRGTVYLRRWGDARNAWIEDIDSFSEGRYEFSLPKDLSRESLSTSSSAAVVYGPTESHTDAQRLKDIEDHYRQLLLETCDIMNLANLPEQDRNLAQRQLELRRLYVPLYVWVEAKAGEKDDEKLWQRLEENRTAIRHNNAKVERGNVIRRQASVGERLASARRLLILGDPGAGKTTLTRWIATAYLLRLKHGPDWRELPGVNTLPDQDLLPIIVRCRDLDPDCLSGSLDDILHHSLRKAELNEADAIALRQVLRERLKEGKALLMLDGLDEIVDPAARTCFCQQLENIVLAYPNASILATSRIVGYREIGYRLGRGFEHVTLAELEQQEKDGFARRWCDLTELPERRAQAIEELIHDIHSADRIERLTGNPMLLTTLALVKRKVGKLPKRRAELYWEAVQVLLNWRHGKAELLDQHEAIPQLEYLAYAMCDQGVQQLRKDEVLEQFARMREDYPNVYAAHNHTPEEFLRLLETRAGILVEAGHAHYLGMLVPVYEFRHLTFQEYLAARALVDGRFPGRAANRRLAEYVIPLAGRTTEMSLTEGGPKEIAVVENWREALRLCADICNDDDIDNLLRAVLALQEDEPFANARARAVLAALCLADEPNASEETAKLVLQTLAEWVGENDGVGRPETSIDTTVIELASTHWAPAMRTSLIEQFRRREAGKRWHPGSLAGAAGVAGAPKDATKMNSWLIDQVRQIQMSDESLAISATLNIMELAFEDKARLMPGLVDGLLNRLHGSAPMAHAAVWALRWLNYRGGDSGKLWQPKAADIEHFVAIINDANSDAGVVRNIALIMREEKFQRAVEPFIVRLNDSDAEVRSAAAHVLGSIESERAVEPLIARLADSETDVRSAAARALGNIESERAVEPLIARLADSETDVRSAAAEALGNIESERAIEPLVARLADLEAQVRSAAADALGNIESERAAELLLAQLADPESNVRRAAAYALGQIGSERAVEPLLAQLDALEVDVRSMVAYALGQIGSERAVEPLLAQLDTPEIQVRSMAAYALGSLNDERALEPLIARLTDSENDVRSMAALALGNLKDKRAIDPLIAQLDDPEAQVRSMAAYALGNLKDERAVDPLIAQLDDPEAQVRSMAAYALGNLKDERAVELLLARLDDFRAQVRSAAADALGILKNERAIKPLLVRLDDSRAPVRGVAAYVLGRIGSERVVEPLLNQLDALEVEVRSAVAGALGNIRSERAVKPLLALLDAPEAQVRSAAIHALGNIGSDRAVEPLIACLDDSESTVRRAAALALDNIGSERAVEPLIACLDDFESKVRRAAAYALGDIGSERAVEPLILRLNDYEIQVRSRIANALGKIGSESAIKPLIALMENAGHQMQSEAAYSLGVVYRILGRDTDAIPALQQVIKINPKHFTAHTSLASCYHKLGCEAETAEHVQIARKMMASESDYNLACFESICGNADKALDLLKVALEKKEASRAWARRDPDFDFIRDNPRFRELMERRNSS